MKVLRSLFSLGLLAAALAIPGQAKPVFLQRAKGMGLPGITSCKACHISTDRADLQWNERGNWLRAKKKELKAGEVDVAWLKDYKPAP